MSRDRFGDGKVAVDADEGQKQHAAVEADLINGVHGFAQPYTQHPFCHGVGCPKGEGQGEEQVCEGQVEQVHIGHGLESLEVDISEDDEHVSCQPQEAGDGEKDGRKHVAELAIGLLLTEFRNVTVIEAGEVVFCECSGCVISIVGQARLQKTEQKTHERSKITEQIRQNYTCNLPFGTLYFYTNHFLGGGGALGTTGEDCGSLNTIYPKHIYSWKKSFSEVFLLP